MKNLLCKPTPNRCVTLNSGWVLALVFSTAIQAATPEHTELEQTDDFSQLATTMQESGKPLVLAFEAEYCAYCVRLKAEHLHPMLNNDEYNQRVLIRSFEYGSNHEIKDFDGQPISASTFSSRYKVRITPTLLFLNAKGEEVAERMLGYNTPEFYGAYLDRAIETAIVKMTE